MGIMMETSVAQRSPLIHLNYQYDSWCEGEGELQHDGGGGVLYIGNFLFNYSRFDSENG